MKIEEAKNILFHLRNINTYLDLSKDKFLIPKENIVSWKEATETVLNELEKKDKVINEIEDLCIRKSDEEGQEYGGVIIWNFANKIMDIIKKHKNSTKQ